MNTFTLREHRHGLLELAALALPMLWIVGCSSASSGHAPGVAGGQKFTPRITKFSPAYRQRPGLTKDGDVRDLITSIISGGFLIFVYAQSARAPSHPPP